MLFGRTGSTWTQRQYLKAPNTGAGDRFALPVISDDGLTIAVGANGEDSSARGIDGDGSDNSQVDSGAAYLY
jgi:hypothetical protein